MSFCTNCGNRIEEDMKFCTSCGIALNGMAESTQPSIQKSNDKSGNKTKACAVCGKKVGVLTRIKIKDGVVCYDCQNKSLNMSNCDCRTAQDYLERFAYLEANAALFASFSPTISVDKYLQVDENHKLFKIGNSIECISFDSLVNFELNEDGETFAKGGLGRAAVGGVLFGGVGAIVGGVTGKKKNKSIINSMYIRISLNDKWIKSTQINLISSETKKSSFVYKINKGLAEKIVSALEVVLNQQKTAIDAATAQINQMSTADEIIKFKQLLDTGAITSIEYEAKKQQLLGL